MTSFKITLSYDGAAFVGWQRQAGGISVQGLVEEALRELDGREVAVAAAGRTDAGVHALGQVAGFSLERVIDATSVVRALNARLPESVRILAAEQVDERFHPRFDAREKRYRYRIWNAPVASPFERSYAWHVHDALDVAAMSAAARLIEGRRDFASFNAAGSAVKTTIREVFTSTVLRQASDPLVVSLSNQEPLIAYEITGNGFLRHMVRTIVGTLVEVGRGRRPPEWMADVIAAADRGAAGPTAPAHGLFLVAVTY